MKKILFALCSFLPAIVGAQQTGKINAGNSLPLKYLTHPPSQNIFSAKSLFVPGFFIAYGVTSLKNEGLTSINLEFMEEIQEEHPHFRTKLDDYLMFSPAAGAFLLEATGVKGKHNMKDKFIIYGSSLALMTLTVTVLKNITQQLRPDGSKYNSFPSGHTATAFMSAEFLSSEYGFRSPWYRVAGYSLAGGTGVLRMYNNKHWFADVVAGAGIGILCTKFNYWVFNKIDKKKNRRASVKY